MKTLLHVFYAKFNDNYYVVYSTCFNKFNVISYTNINIILRHLKYHTNFLKYVFTYHNKVL